MNTNMMKSTPMNVYMPARFRDFAQKIWDFEPRKDDVWIITYPKCGTTLTQELMWQIANGVQIDSENSKKNIFLRVPFIEFTGWRTFAHWRFSNWRFSNLNLPIRTFTIETL